MIEITARSDGFRRAGMAHSSTTKKYPDDFFTPEQLVQLKAEPMLVVVEVEDEPEEELQMEEQEPVSEEIALDPEAQLIAAAMKAVAEGNIINGGAPAVDAMAEILGREVSASDRDLAWEAIKISQAEQKAEA